MACPDCIEIAVSVEPYHWAQSSAVLPPPQTFHWNKFTQGREKKPEMCYFCTLFFLILSFCRTGHSIFFVPSLSLNVPSSCLVSFFAAFVIHILLILPISQTFFSFLFLPHSFLQSVLESQVIFFNFSQFLKCYLCLCLVCFSWLLQNFFCTDPPQPRFFFFTFYSSTRFMTHLPWLPYLFISSAVILMFLSFFDRHLFPFFTLLQVLAGGRNVGHIMFNYTPVYCVTFVPFWAVGVWINVMFALYVIPADLIKL